jgi:HPr Serine kinase C-terminal domain
VNPVAESALRPTAPAARLRSRSFGLDLELGFAAPALPAVDGGVADPTLVELGDEEALRAAWPAGEARRTGWMGPPERRVMTVDAHPEAGYLIHLPAYGRFLVSSDGRSVACAPSAPGPLWQNALVGQVLPAAASLQGYEVLHASALRVGGRAVALVGASGAGKSSLALRLLERGATLLADDVAVVAERDGRLVVEPSSALVNIRDDEVARLGGARLAVLGETIGRSEGKLHVVVQREHRPTSLGVVYLLERAEGSPVIEPVSAPGAAEILPTTFVTYVHRADRLIRQLDLAALLARTVPVARLRVQPGWDAGRLAAAVEEHAEQTS